MRASLYIMVVLLVISCTNQVNQTDNLSRFIPRKAALVVKTENWETLQSDLANCEPLQKLKKTTLFKNLKSEGNILNALKIENTALLSFVPLGKNEFDLVFIAKANSIINQDSTKQSTFSKRKYNSKSIYSSSSNNTSYHFTLLNNTVIGSTSSLLVENAIRTYESKQFFTDDVFLKLYETSGTKSSATVFINGEYAPRMFKNIFPKSSSSFIHNSYNWASIDVTLEHTAIQLNGVLKTDLEKDQILDLLKDTHPTASHIAKITPIEASGAISLSYEDWQALKKNIAHQEHTELKTFSPQLEPLFSNSNEIGVITVGESKVIAARPLDLSITTESFENTKTVETFRELDIKNIEDSLAFKNLLNPLLAPPNVHFYAELDEFLIFGNTIEDLKTIIANTKNNATLAARKDYNTISERLSNSSSLYFIGNTKKLQNSLKDFLDDENYSAIQDIDFSDYPFLLSQVTTDDGFLHVHSRLDKNKVSVERGAISQLASIKLNADLATVPQLVKNHRTKGMDIVVQDVNNDLYLIDNTGKILWKKSISGRVLGEIKQVDLYKNGRLQLAFNTPDTFYILDRNGNEVSPFPLEFEDPITQPLAVFDYDNNRNYRFIVTQGNQLFMYNSDANIVKGFTFTEASHNLVFEPKHIRIGSKDYIVICQEDGTLNILDRTGDTRVAVNEKFNFSKNQVYEGNKVFELHDKNGTSITIDQKGVIKKENNNYDSEILYTRNVNTKAIFSENKLVINNKELDLDYGLYEGLSIERIGKKDYIILTDTQSKKVYIFNNKGKLLPNFPIYGNSKASLQHLERNGSLGFTTQGESDSVLLYLINAK